MAFLIGGANSAADTGFSVANSCRFNDGDSADMNRTFGTPTLATKYTFSLWVKRSTITARQQFFKTSGYMYFEFQADDKLHYIDQGTGGDLVTSRLFKDPSAWYHICLRVDNTLGTADDRHKIYVNGTQETSFDDRTNPTQNNSGYAFKADTASYVGSNESTNLYFDGYIAEFVGIDGLALAPTSFGEFDEDSPTIWKPIDVSGLTFGTNGFYLDFEDSANLGNDANGGTDLTEVNLAATDQATDTPTLNYMTLNPLAAGVGDVARIPTFSEGNTKFTAAGSNTYYQAISTFGVAVGKWYFEVKVASDQDLDKLRVGYWNIDKTVASGEIQDVSDANSHVFYMNKDGGEMRLNTTPTTADYGTFADDELMGVAIDMDAQTITILKANSVIVNAYDYSGGIAAGTVLTPAFMGYDDTAFQVNFGNPHEANSSDAADENGYGAFEFAPPSGYLAFNSANLGSDGG